MAAPGAAAPCGDTAAPAAGAGSAGVPPCGRIAVPRMSARIPTATTPTRAPPLLGPGRLIPAPLAASFAKATTKQSSPNTHNVMVPAMAPSPCHTRSAEMELADGTGCLT
ncbi:hypothetical protein B6264_28515 [Kitasatospora aureofaciens]|nr:hypothetical protein B6264_28515 [Kitasatospora aureofaciens]